MTSSMMAPTRAEVHRAPCPGSRASSGLSIRPPLRQRHQGVAHRHRIPGFHRDAAHGPDLRGADFGFHLHGFQNRSSTSPSATVWPLWQSPSRILPASGRVDRGACAAGAAVRTGAGLAAVSWLISPPSLTFHHKGFAFHFHTVCDTEAAGFKAATGCAASRLRQWLKRRRVHCKPREFEADLREQRHGESSSMAFPARVIPSCARRLDVRFPVQPVRFE